MNPPDNLPAHNSGLAARVRETLLAPQRIAAASRIIVFPTKLRQLWSMKFMDQFFRERPKRDSFFFLTHEYYLSRYFTLAQRIDCAISHYTFEEQNHTPAYRHSVYQQPQGLVLWQKIINGVRYMITLCATEDTRHEGDLSISCLVDGVRVCRVAFSYVDQSIFGQPSQRAMFVTRNQTYQGFELQLFRKTFRQNSPPYFCIAAASGIAMANGMHAMYMVKADAQIAFAKKYAIGFRNSYSALWLRLGAREIDDRHAYSMAVPLPLVPISAVSHKSRAVSRRRNWLEIALCARRTMLSHRARHEPPPIGGGPGEALPSPEINAHEGADTWRQIATPVQDEFGERYPAWNLVRPARADRREEQARQNAGSVGD